MNKFYEPLKKIFFIADKKMIEDTTVVINSRTSKKNKQYNDQKKKGRQYNDQKKKDRQ
jgi:hypothetical protein